MAIKKNGGNTEYNCKISKLCRYLTMFSLLLTSILCSNNVYAQGKQTIKGTVTIHSNGEPLPGATVVVKDSISIGTITDGTGKYSLDVPSGAKQLIFTFIGMESVIVDISSSIVDVAMKASSQMVDEIVTIGYGTQRKGDVTSAVATVKAEDFLAGKVQDASELIKGKVAGLTIAKSSGDPNASSTIRLRGISTLTGSVEPLVLIDGVVGDMTSVAPENIESIDVLKDASAAAIYGTRGANGVIIITTKSGQRNERSTVSYSAYASTSDFMKEAEFMDYNDVRWGRTAFNDDGWDTDWLDAVTQNAFAQNHSISASGGTKNFTYSANFTYRDEQGTIKRSDREQKRMQMDVTQYLANDMVKLNFNLLKGIHENSNNNASASGDLNIYRQAVIRNPTSPIYEEATGEYYEEFSRFQYYNPVSMLNELIGTYRSDWTYMTGNITVEPIKNWKTNLMLANQTSKTDNSTYTTSKYYTSITSGRDGSASKSFGNANKNFLELTSSYNFDINEDHRISVLGGYSYSYEEYDGFSAGNSDFPTDEYEYNNISLGAMLKEGRASMNSYKNDNTLIGFFGRATYSYKNKYNLLASFRYEGSSKFGNNHKWGAFPSVSAGWTISEEEFMKNISWVDNIKLRAGYGVTGIIPGSSYLSLTTYTYDSAYGNFMDEDGNWVPGLGITQNPNPDLKWETTGELNIGVDFALFDNRLSGSFDYYNKKTSDLLWNYNVPVPPNMYTSTLANVGEIRNRGFEIMINATPITKSDFEWNTSVTASHNSNKLLSLSNDLYETDNYLNTGGLGDPISQPTHRLEVGKSIGNYWGLKSVGVTEDGFWLIENPKTGKIEQYDSGAMKISDDYRQYLGNGIPKLLMSWSNDFKYKNFDLSFQFSGQFGFEILNEQRVFYENNYIQYNKLKSAADKAYGTAVLSSSQEQTFVSYYLENGNFAKLDNITLGYTYDLSKKTSCIQNLRFYVSGQNLFVITNYKGLDPELSNSDFMSSGLDPRDKYPTLRTYTVGLTATF
ncbi:MAG: SusC/RagA family TonB-linked outer membrane protein [Mangrovibacterium sp.]